MRQHTRMQAATGELNHGPMRLEMRSGRESTDSTSLFRIGGIAFVAAAVVMTVFNMLFPRASDPFDTVAVLTMMAENVTQRQVSFLALTAGIWALTVGTAGIYRSLNTGAAATWARLGFYGILLGATLFTAAAGLGMAATGAAVNWQATGATTTSAEYAVAAALNAADDGVWFMSIIAIWGALGVLGIGMLSGTVYPRWLSGWIVVVGFANACLVGVPLAYGVESQSLFLLFAGLGQLTLVWALVTGIWLLRKTP